MKTNLFKSGAFVLSLFLFAACVDNKYDLDNVDMTIGTSGDLTLPTSSTGDILLKNLMDLKDDGVIKIVDGAYYIVEDGSANIPRIDITPISIVKPVLSPIEASISLDNILSNLPSAVRKNVSIGGYELPDLPNFVYTYTIQDDDGAYYSLEDAVSGRVPKEVIDLTSVSFADNTTLDAKVQLNFGSGCKFINKVHLDSLTLEIPRGLNISKAVFSHWTFVDGKEVLEEVDAIKIDNEKGIIVLTETDKNTMIGEDYEIHISLTFDKAVTGLGGFNFANSEVSISGIFRVNGSFRIETDDFDLEQLSVEQILSVIENRNYDEICPTKVAFLGSAEFVKDISVSSFSGKVKSNVGDIAPIMLNDLPDFLNEPDVVLDLANPVFFVEVDNPLPSDANTAITLSSIYTDGTPTVVKETGNISIPAKSKSVVCMADHFEGIEIPAQYEGLEVVPVAITNLNELLKKLPHEIKVEVADITMDINAMPIPSQYDVKVNYNIFTPLEFGDEFKLVYQGTEEGISDDLEDVDKIDTKEVHITANVETDFPLNLVLSVDVLSRTNESLKNKVVTVSDVVINAHKGPDATSIQPITLVIKPLEGHTIRELLENLDKFHYRAVAQADGEGKLLESAHIKLKDIKITLKGGISYDAN